MNFFFIIHSNKSSYLRKMLDKATTKHYSTMMIAMTSNVSS